MLATLLKINDVAFIPKQELILLISSLLKFRRKKKPYFAVWVIYIFTSQVLSRVPNTEELTQVVAELNRGEMWMLSTQRAVICGDTIACFPTVSSQTPLQDKLYPLLAGFVWVVLITQTLFL